MTRLRRSDCSAPGFSRRPSTGGFAYLDERGRRIGDPAVLERVEALVIPPGWADVWICPLANGHLQATGIDARGRRQYRYHDQWRIRRDAEKFARMEEFARALPALRRRCGTCLAGDGPTRERVLACVVRLLDVGFFRVGGEAYAAENESYGLATLRKEHARVDAGGSVTFDYPAKSGQQRTLTVEDTAVAAVVAQLRRRRSGGDELFTFRRKGRWIDVRSCDVNDFVKDLTGGEFTAKDFRTWAGTVLAAVALAEAGPARSATAQKRVVSAVMKSVAGDLGNTPAVCRKSYVDPRVVDRYRAGVTIAGALGASPATIEQAVLALLDDAPAVAGEPKAA